MLPWDGVPSNLRAPGDSKHKTPHTSTQSTPSGWPQTSKNRTIMHRSLGGGRA
jgi:hypothetical protein